MSKHMGLRDRPIGGIAKFSARPSFCGRAVRFNTRLMLKYSIDIFFKFFPQFDDACLFNAMDGDNMDQNFLS